MKRSVLPYDEYQDEPTLTRVNGEVFWEAPEGRADAIYRKCFDCMPYAEEEPGTHLEQIACCTIRKCGTYPYRAMPRGIRRGTLINESKVQAIRDKLDAIADKRRQRGR